ncbi:MAG: zinc-dependent metalloprotease [Candidatus Nanopelagicaceae bacterium]
MTPDRFGFGPEETDGPDNNEGKDSKPGQEPNQNPDGFEIGAGFDLNEMIRQMQVEFQKIMPGSNPFGPIGFFNPTSLFTSAGESGNASQSALPKEVIREVAKRFIQAQGSQPVGANDVAKMEEALSIANIWLEPATVFPQVSSDHPAISPLDWLNNSIDGWHSTFEPLASGLADAISRLIEEASSAMQEEGQSLPQLGAMGQILRSFIGSMLATQMGQTIGALASASKGAHDAALPISAVNGAKPSLLPQTLRKFGEELQIPETEIAIYFALREVATVRLFESNPWLVSYMKAAIAEYGKGIHIDLDAIQRQAEDAMRNMEGGLDQNGNDSFTIALNNGLFTPEETPRQAVALEKLETALALIDGWIEEVIKLAADNRLPSLAQLTELLRRERVSNSPIQQLFKALFNLEVSPRQIREATNFWSEIRAIDGIANRDKIWSGLLPNANELKDPTGFLRSSSIPDDLSGLN